MANQKDVVILHGMFSCSSVMRPLERALERRGIYRKLHSLDIKSLSHRQVPKVYAEKNAILVAKELDRKVSTRSLSRKFDVIGHSNGGYVALFLHRYLMKGEIDLTFTVASPKGFSLLNEIDLPKERCNKIFHFRGGVDGVPFGFQHNPGNGEYVITFPDEGHSSIHLDSDKNGLADIVALANGKGSPEAFVDNAHTIHIWPFCKSELGIKKTSQIPFSTTGGFLLCNGMHDTKLETFKAEKAYWDTLFMATPKTLQSIGAYAIVRLHRYVKIRSLLNEKLSRVHRNIATAQMYGKDLRDGLTSLELARVNLTNQIHQVERRVDLFYAAAKRRHKIKLERAVRPLHIARAVSETMGIVTDDVLICLTQLLEESEQEFSIYFNDPIVREIEKG